MLHITAKNFTKPVPKPVQELLDLLVQNYARSDGPDCFLSVDEPLHDDGVWQLDFSTKAGSVVIGWQQGKPFGLTDWEFPGMDDGKRTFYGEGWHHTTDSPEDTLRKISEMIQAQVSGPIQDPAAEKVPQEVRDLVGKAMKPDALDLWWTTPIEAFGNRRPKDLWESGGQDRGKFIDFVMAGLSGDMA